jgi:hypothetical protein
MINIIKTTFTEPKDIYRTTKNADILKLTDVADDTEIEVIGYTHFEDVKEDGEVVEILAIMDKSGQVFATNSATARKDFFDIADIFGEVPFTVIKGTGTSKAGRKFVYFYI